MKYATDSQERNGYFLNHIVKNNNTGPRLFTGTKKDCKNFIKNNQNFSDAIISEALDTRICGG